jgi:uncharacterized protein YjbI with pentapeptide repeats
MTVLRGFHTRESFVGQDLRQATLNGASFKMCDFRRADLRGASLRGTYLAGCDLREADLRYADLTGAVLTFVNTGDPGHGTCNVTGARLDEAILKHVRLDRVVGWPAPGPIDRVE